MQRRTLKAKPHHRALSDIAGASALAATWAERASGLFALGANVFAFLWAALRLYQTPAVRKWLRKLWGKRGRRCRRCGSRWHSTCRDVKRKQKCRN